ncbi:MAG: hypothetical protein PHY48_08100 [Candidatus Cloacimonetes bacterium]|nr:hypothetical protein [Candidatus Cloacimonadota bacterium]
MSVNVYYKKVSSTTDVATIQAITRQLLDVLIANEQVQLSKVIPLKVHFGEAKNVTYLKSDNYLGVIDYLKEREIESCYIETSVLYGGQRYKQELHAKTAEEHGFTSF